MADPIDIEFEFERERALAEGLRNQGFQPDSLRTQGFQGSAPSWGSSPDVRRRTLSQLGTMGIGLANNLGNAIPGYIQEAEDNLQTARDTPSEIYKALPAAADFAPEPRQPYDDQKIFPPRSSGENAAEAFFQDTDRQGEALVRSPLGRGVTGASKFLTAIPKGVGNAYLNARTEDVPPEEREALERQIKWNAVGNMLSLIPGLGYGAKMGLGYVGGRVGDNYAKFTDDVPDETISSTEGMSDSEKRNVQILETAGGEIGNLAMFGANNALGGEVRSKIRGATKYLGNAATYLDRQDPHSQIARALAGNRDEGQIRSSSATDEMGVRVEERGDIPLSKALREELPEVTKFNVQTELGKDGDSHFIPLREHLKTLMDESGEKIDGVYAKLPEQSPITYGDLFEPIKAGGGKSSDAEVTPRNSVYNREIQRAAEKVLPPKHLEEFLRIHLKLTEGEGTNLVANSPRLDAKQKQVHDAYINWIESEALPTAELRKVIGEWGDNSAYTQLTDPGEAKKAKAYQAIDGNARKLRNKYVGEALGEAEGETFSEQNRRFAVASHAHGLADKQAKTMANSADSQVPQSNREMRVDVPSWVQNRWPDIRDKNGLVEQALPYQNPNSETSRTRDSARQLFSAGNKVMTPINQVSPVLTDPTVQAMTASDMGRYRNENEAPLTELVKGAGGIAQGGWYALTNPIQNWQEGNPQRGAGKLLDGLMGMFASDAEGQNPEMPIGPTSPTGNPNFKSLEAGNFDTPLDPQQQQGYEQWKATLPQRLQWTGDYDLQGFYKDNGPVPFSGDMHMPDTYKKPNHPTFSNESQYAPMGNPGSWNGNTFMPPAPPNFAEQPFRRDVSFVTQNRQAFIERVANLSGGNPQLLKDVSTVLTNPNQNQKETALAQLAVNLPELFVTARYPSEMNGKLYDPVDKDEFEKEITTQKTNGQVDPIFWAKQVSALNVDGRILQQEQPPMGPQSPFSSPPPRVETPVGSRRSYDY